MTDTRQNYMLVSLLGFFLVIDVMVRLLVAHNPSRHLKIRSLEIKMEMEMALARASPLRLPWAHHLLPLPLKKVDKVKNRIKNLIKGLYGKKRFIIIISNFNIF